MTDHAQQDFRGRLADTAAAYKYILAGNGTVTLVSRKTGTRFTYKIEVAGTCWFVKLLNGPDNERDYRYLGRIHRNAFWPGRANPRPGDIARGAPSMRAFICACMAFRSTLRPAKRSASERPSGGVSGCSGKCTHSTFTSCSVLRRSIRTVLR